jgi:hypothetical protein
MIYFILGFFVVATVVLGYVVYNLLRKVEVYEEAIQNYYTNTTNILLTARRLDNMQMFEKDDEVGSLFQQLIDIIGDLRVVVYEDTYANKHGTTEQET